MRIYKIEPNTEAEFVTIGDDLDSMQAVVGGNIQAIYFANGCTFWMNEDGKGLGLQLNKVATMFAKVDIGLFEGDYIAGTAFITGPEDDEGNTVDCPHVIATMCADANL